MVIHCLEVIRLYHKQQKHSVDRLTTIAISFMRLNEFNLLLHFLGETETGCHGNFHLNIHLPLCVCVRARERVCVCVCVCTVSALTHEKPGEACLVLISNGFHSDVCVSLSLCMCVCASARENKYRRNRSPHLLTNSSPQLRSSSKLTAARDVSVTLGIRTTTCTKNSSFITTTI